MLFPPKTIPSVDLFFSCVFETSFDLLWHPLSCAKHLVKASSTFDKAPPESCKFPIFQASASQCTLPLHLLPHSVPSDYPSTTYKYLVDLHICWVHSELLLLGKNIVKVLIEERCFDDFLKAECQIEQEFLKKTILRRWITKSKFL